MHLSNLALSSILFLATQHEASASDVQDEALRLDRLFSTKTGYWPQQDQKDWTPPPATCTPIFLEGVVRHGARNPGKGDIRKLNKIKAILDEHRDLIKANGPSWVLDWQVAYKSDEQHLLVSAGEDELYEIAKRMKAAFKEVFFLPYTHRRYEFQETQVSRTSQSGSAFTYGLFEGTGTVGPSKFQPVSIWSDSLSVDRKLRFYDLCPAYLLLHSGSASGDIEKGKKQLQALADFKDSELVASLRQNISNALGFGTNYVINTKELHGVYRACNYDTVHDRKTSPWCELIGEQGLRIMEYHDDLKQWWKKGYGHDTNYKMACTLLSDMFSRIDAKFAGTSELRSFIRFGHAETIMPLVTLLGLFKDDFVFEANTPYETFSKRNWRSSYISPFSANVWFAFYKCDEGEPLVRLLINEKEYTIPGCTNVYCPLSQVRKILHASNAECNFDELCDVTPPQCVSPQEGTGGNSKSSGNGKNVIEKPTLVDIWNIVCEFLGLYDHA
eukprot:comp20932_c0_seq1/m.27957 comp20932_c0_seq1/g.27957  ORF comp20932_c0_seq1/g.27957 comp20932_c0_seq1/m.27957 type:complete len:500 (-) comp20932_c0_seq1:33-1532(-)